jgi:16S rRNA (guanine527-N7)-methyltransferase
VSGTPGRILARAQRHGLSVPPDAVPRLAAYFDQLQRWNTKINLTALTDADTAIDRLLLEPLAAAAHLPSGGALIDLGSGGGSPAIPLAVLLRTERLVMVESKMRKAAFLREAARTADVSATVENERFEEIARRGVYAGGMSMVSIRAVRLDLTVLVLARSFLTPTGQVVLFTPTAASPSELPPSLQVAKVTPLVSGSHVVVLKCST